ncbi:hypothetical protein [Clostridiisalibacter paucivorans]|uniref:hypothetical protein n=1 Tax=Clostridiisalibacter paucivorans TaxID=408753 RepID=UPI00047EF691|nr:hypothetical protein [Clostridiisalibacter paucivorans]
MFRLNKKSYIFIIFILLITYVYIGIINKTYNIDDIIGIDKGDIINITLHRESEKIDILDKKDISNIINYFKNYKYKKVWGSSYSENGHELPKNTFQLSIKTDNYFFRIGMYQYTAIIVNKFNRIEWKLEDTTIYKLKDNILNFEFWENFFPN